MKEWTQSEIDALVSCPKRITGNPRRQMVSDRGSKRNGMELESTDGEHRFRAFMRINEAFGENFSIGLDYIGAEPGSGFCLIRCNGPHEGTGAGDDASGPGITGVSTFTGRKRKTSIRDFVQRRGRK